MARNKSTRDIKVDEKPKRKIKCICARVPAHKAIKLKKYLADQGISQQKWIENAIDAI